MVGGGHGSPGNSDGGNSGGRGGSGGSSGGGGATGGGGRGNNTPGHPGNPGRRGNSAPDGRGNNTPGHPDNPGRVGNSAPDGRGNNTPGSPDNPGRRGTHSEGSTAASRARDAMSRHQRERDVRSITSGGMVIGDNDENAGLGLTHAMDSQQTENALNRGGVTDTLGMGEVDRLGEAVQAGAMLSSTDQQKERGIRHGFNSQFSADRVSDVTGIPGAITGAVASMLGRPSNTMEGDVAIGRERARSNNLGSLGEIGATVGLGKLGANVPGNIANFGAATVRAGLDTNMNALQSSSAPGSAAPTAGRGENPSTPDTTSGAIAAAPTAQTQSFEWNPVDMKQYSRGLLSLAQSS